MNDDASLLGALRSHGSPVVLDGGLGTHLADRGLDVTGALWSAEVLRSRPEEVRAAHRDFLDAGAQVLTTCSYQVSADGLAAVGADPTEAEDLLRTSVRLARETADEVEGPRWVVASIGPYGAGPGRGTEYDGDYGLTVAELRAWHRDRIAVLDDTGADLLLAETVPSIREVEALVDELDGRRTPAALSLTVRGTVLGDGTPVSEAARILAGSSLVAVGVNCCTVPDALTAHAILREHSDLPLMAYPNSGESWDHEARAWREGSAEQDLVASAPGLLGAGVRLLGGCCRVGPEQISRLATSVGVGVGTR